MPSVEPMTRARLSDSAGVLARAFQDNPARVALFPKLAPDQRLAALGPCMDAFAASVLRYGTAEIVTEGERVLGVSLAFGPGGFPPPFWATVMQAPGPLRQGISTALRFARIDHEMRKRHPHFRHWYLWFLGVEPERQGKGLGSLLLRSLSGRAKADGVPCYLETDKPTSVKLYERHGYRVDSEEVIVPMDVRLWFMTRPAEP